MSRAKFLIAAVALISTALLSSAQQPIHWGNEVPAR
jgi:hypothetical protein